MVKDRETKMKESLKIMGCPPWIYSLSFIVQRSIWILLPTFFVSISIWLFNRKEIEPGTAFAIFLMLQLFGMGMLAITMVF